MKVTAGLALLLALAPAPASADDLTAAGPLEWREHWLLAQGRLTLPPVSPEPLPTGTTVISIDFDWGNDLGWEQDHTGESIEGRSFLVDGEHRTFALDLRRGLAHGFDAGVRVPLEWRGGGLLDGVIEWFHGFTRALGLPDNGRRTFLQDLLRADLRHDGEPLAWDDRSGTGLGRIEVSGRWAPFRAVRGALVLRLALPTSTGPLRGGGAAAAVQVVAAHGLGRAADVYGGFGASFESDSQRGGVDYAAFRPEGFLAYERRFGRRWSAVAQSNAAGRLITNVDRYPAIQWYVSLGSRLRLDSGWTAEGGFTENIANQQATTDFGVQVTLSRRFGRRR
jgi:hypothetical protein